MADRSALPPEILAQVPCKSCRVQKTKDGYKVYKYKAVKLPSGKWGNDSGTLIGIIVPGEGFHPNDAYQDVVNSTKGRSGENREKAGKKPTPFTPPPDGITDLAYGSYGLLLSLSLDLFGQLNRCFSYDVAAQVYSYAAILCVEGYLEPEQIADRYEGSILSLLFENYGVSMDSGALRNLLHDLCQRGMPARHFKQQLLEAGGKEIALRIPVFRPRTPRIDLDLPFDAPAMPDTRQTYLFLATDTASRRPVFLETAEALELAEKRAGYFLEDEMLQDTTFLADPLLYTPDLLAAMSRNGNRYVIPLPRDTEACQRIHQHVLNASHDFFYRKPNGEGLDIISYCEEEIEDGRRLIAYKNLDENNEACKQYLMALGWEEDGYTWAEFDAEKAWWGCSFLETTAPGTAAALYAAYRESRTIPGFPAIRNLADLADSSVQDYYEQHGLDVVLLASGILAARLQDKVRSLGEPDRTAADVLAKSSHLRMSLEADGAWHLRNARPQDVDLLAKMGFTPLKSVRSGSDLLKKALVAQQSKAAPTPTAPR